MEAVGIGVGHAGRLLIGRGELAMARHDRWHRPVLQIRHVVERLRQAQPVLVRAKAAQGRTEIAEGMEEAVADVAPVLEFDAELEAGLGLADKVGAVQAQRVVVDADRGQGRLAHPDGADLGRFHQRHLAGLGGVARQALGQRGRRHPAGGAAAHDDDPADRAAMRVIAAHLVSRHVFLRVWTHRFD
jgi:hypothetical protein